MFLIVSLFIYYLAINLFLLLGGMIGNLSCSFRCRRFLWVCAAVILLTPMPLPVAFTVLFVPSGLILLFVDFAWAVEIWRLAAITGTATGYVCWLFSYRMYKDLSDVGASKLSWAKAGSAGLGCVAVMAALVVSQNPDERGPFLTTSESKYFVSCHNLMRDGRRQISPQVVVDLDVSESDWQELTAMYRLFAAQNALQFHHDNRETQGEVKIFYLSVCNDGFAIQSNEQRWESKGYAHAMPGHGVGIAVYETATDSGWRPVFRRFIEQLEARWPSAVRFRDPNGALVEKPDWLTPDGVSVD